MKYTRPFIIPTLELNDVPSELLAKYPNAYIKDDNGEEVINPFLQTIKSAHFIKYNGKEISRYTTEGEIESVKKFNELLGWTGVDRPRIVYYGRYGYLSVLLEAAIRNGVYLSNFYTSVDKFNNYEYPYSSLVYNLAEGGTFLGKDFVPLVFLVNEEHIGEAFLRRYLAILRTRGEGVACQVKS